jgi:hypothetical protein
MLLPRHPCLFVSGAFVVATSSALPTSVIIPPTALDGQIVSAVAVGGDGTTALRVQVPQGALADAFSTERGAFAPLALNRGLHIPDPTPEELASLQVHLHHTSARAGDPNDGSVAISWATPTARACKPEMTVSAAAATGQGAASVATATATITQDGATRTYPDAVLADGSSAASFQHVVLGGLVEGARYDYSLACAGYGSYNGTFAAPRRTAGRRDGDGEQQPYSFGVFGDMGISTAAHDTVRSLAASAPALDAVFHIGDISYAINKETVWNQFMAMIEPVAAAVPWSVMPGNHDMRKGDSGTECGLPMLSRFETPSSRAAQPHLLAQPPAARCAASFGNAVGNPFWWAADAGHARIITYSSDSNLTKGSAQYAWLAAELAAANAPAARAVHPWLLLMGHKPMYTASTYSGELGTRGNPAAGEGTEGQLTAELEELFVAHAVDVSFYGHIHSYNRMFPVKANGTYVERGVDAKVYRAPKAPVHMMIGMAGAGHLGKPFVPMPWSAYAEIAYGWVRATFANASALHLEFVANGDGLQGEYAPAVHDDVWITK